ncbi:uncharacterized protein B0I36DRAFT_356847 [Microdochium trichocladiopsis]|uniref:Uncharacterized protein n=1 Tax=Microdochium trichocladiopsis TaxID=1682393 RepID=A0A9P9BH12_9PEZI|nr:uncharacterized protein B0I36DRAFT_356847 [Microdochium trichocladiopsis]KAH7009124.1 hypothetical protein B0I36DRAFT_356847 [Microdochium trichocladiopsis]
MLSTTLSTISQTITSLPADATLETLTGGFTDGTIITTTTYGSNESIAVPVIVPAGGSPLIGFLIRNCFDVDVPTNLPIDQTQIPDTSPTSTSSCQGHPLATYYSVVCSTTAGISTSKPSPSCSTYSYSTTVGCDVPTVSTTTTYVPAQTQPVLCGPETCGESCVSARAGLAKRQPPLRDSEPPSTEWAGPQNYNGDMNKFMRGEVAKALLDPGTYVPHGFGEGGIWTTSNWITFKNEVRALTVQGLYGCTSIVAVSTRGAWASHIWENPSFKDDSRFEIDAIEDIRFGKNVKNLHEIGLYQLRDNVFLQPEENLFDDVADPHIYIMTPIQRYRVMEGEQQVWSNDEETRGHPLAFPDKVARIISELRSIFNETTPIIVKPYSPMTKAPDILREIDGSPILDVYGREQPDRGDIGFNTHRGKLLVQYQPASKRCHIEGTGSPQAQWRIWFENQATQSVIIRRISELWTDRGGSNKRSSVRPHEQRV